MFGLTIRERCHSILERVYESRLGSYKDAIYGFATDVAEGKNPGVEAGMMAVIDARCNYLIAVVDAISGIADGAPFGVRERLMLAVQCPSIAEISEPSMYMQVGESAYRFLYYAFTGKVAKQKDAEQSQKRADYYMNKAVEDVDAETKRSVKGN